MDLSPILTMTGPFLRDIHHRQIQHFQQAVFGGKYGLGLCDFSKLTVKSFDRIRRIDQTPDRFRVLKISR